MNMNEPPPIVQPQETSAEEARLLQQVRDKIAQQADAPAVVDLRNDIERRIGPRGGGGPGDITSWFYP
jgi:hypothetical protein